MNVTKEKLKNINVGDIIEFAEIDWRVLEKTSDRVMVISEHVIAQRYYNPDELDITWETCPIRKWLNEDFYSIFTDEEKDMIAETKVFTSGNSNETTEKIFLLSMEETYKYSSYVKPRSGYQSWWVRSNRKNGDGISYSGLFRGNIYSIADGVRPVLNLKY